MLKPLHTYLAHFANLSCTVMALLLKIISPGFAFSPTGGRKMGFMTLHCGKNMVYDTALLENRDYDTALLTKYGL